MAELPVEIVLFGGTGDLVMRKLLPALYRLARAGLVPQDTRIVGAALAEMSSEAYRALADTNLRRFLGDDFVESDWQNFREKLAYVRVDARALDTFSPLAKLLRSSATSRVFYLSTAPSLFASIGRHLSESGLITATSRVILEKPLGFDLASSRRINDEIGEYFNEEQIFRIDHYLGKEPVQNLLALRFGNSLFEPLWRREWVRDVQITVAEELGVEGRGEFYDKTGALRDMVQNHLLQLLCIVAMEPPTSISADVVRDEKLKVLRALRPISVADAMNKTVRGQYKAGAVAGKPVRAYVDEDGISPDSTTETFVALKAEIDSWRWAGVPFYLRTGKRLQKRIAEIVVNFRPVPHAIFEGAARASNRLVIQMQPNETVMLHMLAKEPGDQVRLKPVALDLDFLEAFTTRRLEAYERLLMDAIRGQLTLFVRRDEQEAAWQWVEPILQAWAESPDKPKTYMAGTWGPSASIALPERDGLTWHEEY